MSIFVKVKLLIGAFLLPRTLRSRMICLAVFMVFLPILVISYLVEEQGKDALLNEKKNKLLSITHLLDQSLGDDFSRFSHLLRKDRITALNNTLTERTEVITRDFPRVGAGFYNKELDAIITYAPKKLYGNKVGVSIDESHPGRIAMETGITQIKLGTQVRGDILNVMLPIRRDGKVIGYIWANESSNDINKQTWAMDASIISVSIAGLMSSLLLIISFSRRLSRDVDMIKQRLSKLPFDLNTKLPPLAGEMEGIADKINHLSYALKEAKTLNELIIESAADGMISIDIHGRIIMCNPAASTITGYSFNELFNKSYADIFEKEGFHSPLLDTLKRGVEHIGIEVSYPAKDHILQIKASSSQLRNADEEIIGALVTFTDLTEQKEMQRHMAQAERLATLGELMASVAHEVRNPLTAISGFVQYLKESERDLQRIEYIDIILHEVRSINNVIQQLLNLSHVHPQIFHKSSINKIIRDSLILVQTNGLTSRVDFNIHLDDRVPDIDVDASGLKQVFLNLLINAVQAIKARGEITISTVQSAIDKIEIKIEDNGVGMNDDIKKKIFMPFLPQNRLALALDYRLYNGLSMSTAVIL